MRYFIFDLQRFGITEIDANNSVPFDGVTYTAINNAVLNLDDAGKVLGIASGSCAATATSAENSPTVTLAGRVFKFIHPRRKSIRRKLRFEF